MRSARLCGIAALVALLTLTLASPALAAGGHERAAHRRHPRDRALVGGVLSSIGGAVLGGLKWTVGIAAKFILATIAGW